jgi:hypothetical protein
MQFFIRPQGTVFCILAMSRKDCIAARLGHYHKPAVYELIIIYFPVEFRRLELRLK